MQTRTNKPGPDPIFSNTWKLELYKYRTIWTWNSAQLDCFCGLLAALFVTARLDFRDDTPGITISGIIASGITTSDITTAHIVDVGIANIQIATTTIIIVTA